MEHQINQFDKVRLRTTRHIHYLSAPPGSMPSPHGIWSVVGNLGRDLLVAKGGAICRVPVADVQLAGRSLASHLMEKIDGKERDEAG